MASPLLRNLFGDYHNLRRRPRMPVDQHLKAPKFDPESVLTSGEEAAPRKLRLRSSRATSPLDQTNPKQPTLTDAAQNFYKSDGHLHHYSKPLPMLPTESPSPGKAKKIKKRKLPRAVTKRNVPQRKSKLHLIAVPGQDVADSAISGYSRVKRLASPFDNLPNGSECTDLQRSNFLHLSESDDTESQVKVCDHHFREESKGSIPDVIQGHDQAPSRDLSIQSSVWWSNFCGRPIRDFEQSVSPRASTAKQQAPCSKSNETIVRNDMQYDQIIESTENDPQASCGHVLGFHLTQQAILDCIDLQRNDGMTMLTSSQQSLSTKKALEANNSLPSNEDNPSVSPPPSFRRSATRISRLERLLTSVYSTSSAATTKLDIAGQASCTPPSNMTMSGSFTPRAPSVSPISPKSPDPTILGSTLDANPNFQLHGKQLERSPSKAILGPQLSPTAQFVSAGPRSTSPSPRPRALRLVVPPSPSKIQPMLGLPAPLVSPLKSTEKMGERFLNPLFANAISKGQDSAATDSQDFFLTYYDAMINGTEHSWTIALRNSDLGDKAIADAYLSNLPEAMIAQVLKKKTETKQTESLKTSQIDGPGADGSTVYVFGTKMDTGNTPVRRSSRSIQGNTSPTKKTVIQGRNLRELELLSPIREERESQSSLLASSNASTSATLPYNPPHGTIHGQIQVLAATDTHETVQCDPCRNNLAGHAKPHKPTKCDKLLPSCTQCISSSTTCSYRSQPDPHIPSQLSMAHRQHLLVHILATAGGIIQPAVQIYQRYRPRDIGSDENGMHLPLGHALDAVVDTIRVVRALAASEIVDGEGVPIHPDSVAEYYGALALVLAAVWALERATTAAEADGGVMLALKTSRNPEHVEFVNRVFEVLAAFGSGETRHGGRGTLHVLDACVAQVEDALWRLWEQMEGGQDENGQAMCKEIHWDVMVEVSKEVLCRGFVDASRLDHVRQALEKVASLQWMH